MTTIWELVTLKHPVDVLFVGILYFMQPNLCRKFILDADSKMILSKENSIEYGSKEYENHMHKHDKM